jgi:DNA-binding CsgD family transcriptional regulator
MARPRQLYCEDTHPEDTLTTRELECVGLLADGLTVGGVANALGTTLGTVRRQLCTAYGKIGISSAIEAVAWWHQRFGDRIELTRLQEQLAEAEKIIHLFGEDFEQAVEAEAGRLMRKFVADRTSG